MRELFAQFRLPTCPESALRFIRLEQDSLSSPGRQLNTGIGARIAHHYLVEQATQFLGLARLVRALSINEAVAKFLRGLQLSRLEERDQVIKFFQRVLHRGGGQEEKELSRQRVDCLPGLRGAVAQVMRLVDDE